MLWIQWVKISSQSRLKIQEKCKNQGRTTGPSIVSHWVLTPLQERSRPESTKARVTGRPQLMHTLTGQSRKVRWDKSQLILVHPELNLGNFINVWLRINGFQFLPRMYVMVKLFMRGWHLFKLVQAFSPGDSKISDRALPLNVERQRMDGQSRPQAGRLNVWIWTVDHWTTFQLWHPKTKRKKDGINEDSEAN